MKKMNTEIVVGFFVLLGILALGYLTIRLGKLEIVGGNTYSVQAEFEKVGGIKPGASVEIAGVQIGTVKSVKLDKYQALLDLTLHTGVKIQEDAIASVKTKGLIGEKYIQITPGASEKIVPPGGKIRDTESALDMEELISKYVFGKI